MSFTDRVDAGRCLASRLKDAGPAAAVVFALPRGGVLVAQEVARALHLPLRVLIVRKVGAPGQPELAIGAVVDGAVPQVVMLDGGRYGFSKAAVERQVAVARDELDRRKQSYGRAADLPESLKGRTAIVVDDGIATGATVLAAIRGLRRLEPDRIIVAAPVASTSAIAMLEPEVDDIVCPMIPDDFMAVGLYYDDFAPVTDDIVLRVLRSAGPPAS